MAIAFIEQENDRFIEVIYSEEIKGEKLPIERKFVSEILSARGLNKVLVDAQSVVSKPSLEAMFEHGMALAAKDFKDIKIAACRFRK